MNHDESIKHTVDAISIAAVAGALMDWLPPIAALLTIIWTAIRIVETDTARALWKKLLRKGPDGV